MKARLAALLALLLTAGSDPASIGVTASRATRPEQDAGAQDRAARRAGAQADAGRPGNQSDKPISAVQRAKGGCRNTAILLP